MIDFLQLTLWIHSPFTGGGSSTPEQIGPLFCILSHSGPPAGVSQALELPSPQKWILSHPETTPNHGARLFRAVRLLNSYNAMYNLNFLFLLFALNIVFAWCRPVKYEKARLLNQKCDTFSQ